MAEKRPALGRGLSALIPPAPPPQPAAAPAPAAPVAPARPTEIDIDLLTPNPRQPRTSIDEGTLEELAQSIRSNGVIQPILVRPSGGRYEIVAGERRWRAAQRAGLLKVPVTIREIDDASLLQVALIENIQREDLNPIEEAQAYRRLADELKLSQESIAGAVGKDRATVANYVRLLRLPAEVRNDLASNALSMGHARALLGLADEAAQRRLAREVVSRQLSVRETEALVRRETTPPPAPAPKPVDPNTRAAEEQLKLALGTRTRIIRKGRGGRIEIDFTSEDELHRLFERLTETR
ncbi:MAG TPA: ParB/RepB/Spo0J family partition protein [Vicinamibacterales bacterium]|jgi:ParB family chromosome partitioning protein|nr:ParB/RepB/Spo0J family partition protein [Vicinamibacterales bacterium]